MRNRTNEGKRAKKDAEKAGYRTEEAPTKGAGTKVCNLLSCTDGLGTLDKSPWDPGQTILGLLDKLLPLAGRHFPISKQGNGTGFSGIYWLGWCMP